jgi:Ca-activated chloride channel family protein
LLLFILALARPQVLFPEKEVEGKGIDIIICMDVSGSMLAEDFIPNRLSAAKEVAAEFVSQRPADRIGVVLFSGEAYTLCPLTSDQKVITSQIGSIRSGMLLDGTAIGNGMATAIMDFPSETSKGKVMLLLTDGENNAGNVLPLEAANWAKQNRIRIYTIGMGTEGYAIMPTATAKGILRQTERVNLDEPLLKAIAAQTSGLYFRAGTKEALQAIWKEIDLLEQSFYLDKITLHREERYFVFVLIGLFLLVIEQCIYLWLAKSFP